MTAHQANPLITYAITALVIGVVFAVRWRRMSRLTPLKLERLWIFPALYAVAAIGLYVRFPPVGWGWAFCLLALGAGAALGWQRGKLMRITVDPATHALNQTASPAAILFLILLVAVRSGARALPLHMNAMALTDMLIAFALGLFTMTRVEVYLRGRRMLTTAKAASLG